MIDSVDKMFLQPRLVLASRRVDLDDAINLVIYAKIPLISVRRGKDLVAGFICLDESGSVKREYSQSRTQLLLEKYGPDIESFRYPIGPAQYEPLLEKMVVAKDLALPYFYQEHHYVADRRLRANLFLELHSELQQIVNKGEVVLQLSDSERTYVLFDRAWMTAETLRDYLNHNGVVPWWHDEENIKTHTRLELIRMSDGLDGAQLASFKEYDVQQLPSYLYAQMLLKRGFDLFENLRPPQVQLLEQIEHVEPAAIEGGNSVLREIEITAACDSSLGLPMLSSLQPTKEISECAGALIPNKAESQCSEPPKIVPLKEKPQDAELQSSVGMMTKKEVAKYLNVSVSTIDNYRKSPNFPEPVTLATNTIRWYWAEIIAWQDSKKRK